MRRLSMFVEPLNDDLAIIETVLRKRREELREVAMTFTPIPYPMQEDELEKYHASRVGVIIESALRRMLHDINEITLSQWQSLSEKYENIPKGGVPTSQQPGTEVVRFTDDMSEIAEKIAHFVRDNEIHIPRIMRRDVVSYKVVAAVAVMYTGEFLLDMDNA